jgi:hypothetical protein
MGHLGSSVARGELDGTAFMTTGLVFLLGLKASVNGMQYRRDRFDWDYTGLKRFLNRQSGGQASVHEIFFSGSSLRVPTEFHHMMMGEIEEDQEFVRALGLETWGRPYVNKLLYSGRSVDDARPRVIANAGDLIRTIFIDHIVYKDETTLEPVWLFFYRSFHTRPRGPHHRREANREPQTLGGDPLNPFPEAAELGVN